jgi:hypothetical protein
MVGIGKFLASLAAGNKADDPTELAAAIARLLTEKSAAEGEMVRISDRRTELLITDDDAGLDRDERLSERAYRIVERCDIALRDLRARLAVARDVERQARWRELKSRHDASVAEFAATYRRALEAFENLAQIRNTAQTSGFAEEARGLIAPPHILTRELLVLFENELDRQRAAAVPQPKPSPRPASPAPATKPQPAPKPKPQKAATPPAKPKPPAPDQDGNLKITVLRPGIEIEGRARPQLGEIVSLPAAGAMRIVESGGADFAEAI